MNDPELKKGGVTQPTKEVPVFRSTFFASLIFLLPACGGIHPGKVILTEDTNNRYFQLREGRGGYVMSRGIQIKNRPELGYLTEVHGDLQFICTDINGLENPRIVIESKNKGHYQVVFQREDPEALKLLAKPLGLVVSQEEREIQAITIRVSAGGPRLKTAGKGQRVKIEDVCCNVDGQWPLDGVTADELARFLETRYRKPVVNLTSLKGVWSILLSRKAGIEGPEPDKKTHLDDLGLELQWEKVKIPVTVIKDKPPKR